MVDEKTYNSGPSTYEDWLDLGLTIIPCLKGVSDVKAWSSPDFKITKEEWKQKYPNHEIALRLDDHVDFDVDNPLVKRFIKNYLKSSPNIFGRDSNPESHYVWKGKLTFKQFILPAELNEYCKIFPHGSTLCEIRTDAKHYTIVPGSMHSKAPEIVKWEKYSSLIEYPGNLNNDLRKIALSSALCILYASQGSRDAYCTAIAGALLKQTEWNEEEINEFIYNIAVAANDDEADKRKLKGTTVKKAGRKFGLPKLAEIIGCSTKAISEIFNWVGTQQAVSEEIAQECIGDVIEYGQDRYIINVTGKLEGVIIKKDIIIDGPTLRNKRLFYDAVMSQASVWIPEMPVKEFETIMMQKFETRTKSIHYVKEANKDLVFIKYFKHYIKQENAYSDKINLLEYKRPFFDMDKKSLDFNLDAFEDFLTDKRIKIARVDLVLQVQRILKAKKNRGKVKIKDDQYKSCVSWKIEDYEIDMEDLIIDGEYKEVIKTESIDFEQ